MLQTMESKFSIMTDESTDISVTKFLSMAIIYHSTEINKNWDQFPFTVCPVDVHGR